HPTEHGRPALTPDLFLGRILDRRAQLDARVVHEDVERPGLADRRIDGSLVADVEGEERDRELPFFSGAAEGFRSSLGMAHRREDAVSRSREAQGREQAETARAPGDEDL